MSMRGEYWFDGYGTALFADGDVGDVNHEGYVVDRVTRDVLDHLGIQNDEEWVGFAEHKDEVAAILPSNHVDDDALDKALVDLYPNAEQRKQAIDIIQLRQQPDPREFAVRYLGWKYVNNGSINTWTLTSDDLRAITRGLDDAYGDDDVDDDDEVYIYVGSTRTIYHVPYKVLMDAKSPMTLRAYSDVPNETRRHR